MNDDILNAIANKSLIDMFAVVYFDPALSVAANKLIALKMINAGLGTKYNVNHFNNWLAGRSETPKRAKSLMRKIVLDRLLGDHVAEALSDLA